MYGGIISYWKSISKKGGGGRYEDKWNIYLGLRNVLGLTNFKSDNLYDNIK